MDYEVSLAPVDKTATTPGGVFEPLCNSCTCPDCSNPIREKTISVMGVPKKYRLYVMSDSMIRQVVACKGYVGDVVADDQKNFRK